MKKVYLVTGSEDGVLAICTNKKAVFQTLEQYQHGNTYIGDIVKFRPEKVIKKVTYSYLCKKLNNSSFVTVDYLREDDTQSHEARIEAMYLKS